MSDNQNTNIPEVRVTASGIFKEDVTKLESGLLMGPGKGKEIASGNTVHSNALEFEDDFKGLYQASGGDINRVIIQPPFNPLVLEKLVKHNNTLEPCIEAMKTNIDGTGYEIVVSKTDEETENGTEEDSQVQKDLNTLREFFAEPWPGKSFTTIRKDLRRDLETIGYGFLEVIRNPKGEIVFLRHVDAKTVRLMQLGTGVTVNRELNRGGVKRQMSINLRFRRFVQKVGQGTVYFKEFQADPDLDKDTGMWAPKGTTLGFQKRASELIYFVLNKDINSPYGVPRWIAQTPSIIGSRQAEENNLSFFNSGGVPPFILIVQGGILAQETKDALEAGLATSSGVKQRGLVIEAHSSSGSIDDKSNVKVQVERFGGEKQKDSQFEQYDDKCEVRVRGSFRLPPIFVGRCHSEDTEYLTYSGWKLFKDITERDRLAQVNVANMITSYATPLERHSYEYEGNLLHLKTKNIDALVTPNHKMLVRPSPQYGKLKPWEFVEASGIKNVKGGNRACVDIPVSSKTDGPDIDHFVIPKSERLNKWCPSKPSKNPTRDRRRYKEGLARNSERRVDADVFAEFLGYFISEGGIDRKRGVFSISQNKGRVATRIIECLESLGLNVSITEARENQLNMVCCHQGLQEWLKAHVGKGAKNKKIPSFVFGLSGRQKSIFLKAMVEGDGHWVNSESEEAFNYSSTSKNIIDGMQRLCFELGYASSMYKQIRPQARRDNTYRLYASRAEKIMIHREDDIKEIPYEGTVHCFTMPLGTLVTRRQGKVLISGNSGEYNFACYDDQTETLTDQGWVLYNEYKKGMKIACYNPETKSLEYHVPEGETPKVYDVSDVPMYHFKNQNIDIKVTPNHNMLYRTPHGLLKLESVEDMVANCSRPSFIAKIHENNEGFAIKEFVPPTVGYPVQSYRNKDSKGIRADLFLRLIGWILSEGHCLKQGNAINLYQNKDRHWEELETITDELESLGYNIWRYKNEGPCCVVTINDRNLYEWVVAHCGDIGHRKKVPSIIKGLRRDQLQVFFDAIMRGDGNYDNREGRSNFSYSSTSLELVNDIQEIALKLGYKASIKKGPPGTEGVRPVYSVSMSVKGRAGGSGEVYACHLKDSLSRVNYTGKVYCFSVPTGVFITRRNGKIAIQGNSAFASYMVGEAQIFKPERDEFDEIVTLRLIPEILGKDNHTYKFRSLPLVVNDAKEKVMALKTAADKGAISKKELVKGLNEVTGLNMMTIQEGEEEPDFEPSADNEGITSDSSLMDASTSDPNGPQGIVGNKQ